MKALQSPSLVLPLQNGTVWQSAMSCAVDRKGFNVSPGLHVPWLCIGPGDLPCREHCSCLPRSTLPRVQSLPQTSKGHGNQTQVAGCPLQQQSCSNFCFKWFVSLLFQLIISVTASKNSQQSWCCDYWCQPPCLPSSAFLLLPFPFLSLLLLLRFVKKGWHFIDITCQAQTVLSLRRLTHHSQSGRDNLMVFRFPLAEFSGVLLLLTKRRVVCVFFWQLSLLEQSQRLGMPESECI